MRANSWKAKILAIWAGESVSLLTSSVLQMAVIWYLTEKTASALMLTFATLAGFLPQAILGLFVGVYVDRYSRKLIIILSDAFVALTSVALAVAASYGDLPLPFLFAILILRSVGTALQEPAVSALTPSFVPPEELTRYAGYQQTFESVSSILSPALAALLYAVWSMSGIMLLDVAGAIVAIAVLLPIAVPHIQAHSEAPAPREGVLTEAKLGWRAIRGQRGMMALLVISALYSIIYCPVGTLYPHITMVYFGGGATASGVVETIFSVGTLVGSLALGAAGNRINKRYGIVASILVYGVGVLIIGLLPPSAFYPFAAISFFMGVTLPFYYGISTAIYQTRIPEEYLGRAFSVSLSARRLAMPVGLVLSGVVADTIGANRLYAALGVGCIALALAAAFSKPLKEGCR